LNITLALTLTQGAQCGAFDARAKDESWELWVDMHRNPLALAGAGIVSLIGTAALFSRPRNSASNCGWVQGVHGTTPRHRKVITCCHRVNGPQ
jgi:hypothetical protein